MSWRIKSKCGLPSRWAPRSEQGGLGAGEEVVEAAVIVMAVGEQEPAEVQAEEACAARDERAAL
ncbi:hypothetical protein [Thiorhodovibrio winogradskyi]|uniref:hypothetical protein n=1 Tax=Thiorhodovibrio winogradskyi TaxID=77007 RepID=UPI002E2B2353|nr:hypothetical protein [Thiorhodovibrio winogradskyi]